MNTVNTGRMSDRLTRLPRRAFAGGAAPSPTGPAAGSDLYSAALVNTLRGTGRAGARTPKTGRIGRDTPRLYALYSVVFRRHLHTNSA